LEEDEKEKDEAQEKEGEKNEGAEGARLKQSPLFFHLNQPEDMAPKEKKCQSDEQSFSAFLTAIVAERYTFGGNKKLVLGLGSWKSVLVAVFSSNHRERT
jgi:hypothetical protein